MLKGQDIVVLLKVAASDANWTLRSLEQETSISRTVIHQSLERLSKAGLYDERRRRVLVTQALEFLVHSVKYIFPPVIHGETRGVPTAWAAQPLAAEFPSISELVPVWPDPHGEQRGVALTPLHHSAAAISRLDPELAENLALVDGLRLGDARVRKLATELLEQRLQPDSERQK